MTKDKEKNKNRGSKKDKNFFADKKGYYLIRLKNGFIEAGLFNYKKELQKIYKGKTARPIYEAILNDENVSRLEHAVYLGKELKNAEFALINKTKYIQDEDAN